MRNSYNGNTLAFQACALGSIPGFRSHEHFVPLKVHEFHYICKYTLYI